MAKIVITIALGDFNAKFLSEGGRNAVEKFDLGNRNARGDILVEFCNENDLYVAQKPASDYNFGAL